MIKTLSIFIGAICNVSAAFAQIQDPNYDKTDCAQCHIMQIGLTDSTTNIFFKYNGKAGDGICINDDYYITDTGTSKKYKMLGTTNIPLCPAVHLIDSIMPKHYYVVSFEALPVTAEKINLIESKDRKGFNFYDVSLVQNFSKKIQSPQYFDSLESSPVRELGYFLKDGRTVQYFIYKGIVVAVTLAMEKAYGRYYTVYFSIENNSSKRIDFYPESVEAMVFQGDREFPCHVLTANEYLKRVKNKQGWNSFFLALGESTPASQAGKSRSVTKSNSHAYSTINANYYGNGFSPISSDIRIYGSSTSTTTTYSYDATANYYAMQNVKNNITQYENQQYQIRENINQGYLQENTILPGQRINGFINIDYKKGDSFYLTVPIRNNSYFFYWK